MALLSWSLWYIKMATHRPWGCSFTSTVMEVHAHRGGIWAKGHQTQKGSPRVLSLGHSIRHRQVKGVHLAQWYGGFSPWSAESKARSAEWEGLDRRQLLRSWWLRSQKEGRSWGGRYALLGHGPHDPLLLPLLTRPCLVTAPSATSSPLGDSTGIRAPLWFHPLPHPLELMSVLDVNQNITGFRRKQIRSKLEEKGGRISQAQRAACVSWKSYKD